mgnify:CR=1 FL=1
MSGSFDPYRKWLGIPPDEQPPNHYRLLGIPVFEDDPDVIENAVNRQMSHVRTFQGGRHAEASQKILNELASAKLTLLLAERKLEYDEQLRGELAVAASPPAAAASAAPPPASPPPASPPPASPPTVVKAAAANPGSLAVGAAPVAVSTGTARKSSISPRSRRKKKSPLPIYFGLLGGALVLVAVIFAIAGRSNPASTNSTNTQQPTPAGPSVTTRFPDPRSPNRHQNNPTPNRFEPPDPPRTFVPPANHTSDNSDNNDTTEFTFPDPNSPANKAERFRDNLANVRQAFTDRNQDRAQSALALAQELKQSQSEFDEIERLDALSTYLSSFWSAVRKSIYSSRNSDPPARFEFEGEEIVLVDVMGNVVEYTANDQKQSVPIRDLPAKHAISFARPVLDEDDLYGLVYLATFLAFDKDIEESRRKQRAAEVVRKAQSEGQNTNYIAAEIGIGDQAATVPTDLPSVPADKPFEAAPPLPLNNDTVDSNPSNEPARSPAPEAAEIAAARSQLLKNIALQFGARPTVAQRREILSTLMTSVREQPNQVDRYVGWTEARELAVDLGDVATLMEAIDALTTEFEINALRMQHAELSRILRNTAADDALLRQSAEEASRDALEQEQYKLAAELIDIAARAARRAKDFASAEVLSQEHERITALADQQTAP